MGIIISHSNLNAMYPIFEIKITETYVFYYDIGKTVKAYPDNISIVEPMLKLHKNKFVL